MRHSRHAWLDNIRVNALLVLFLESLILVTTLVVVAAMLFLWLVTSAFREDDARRFNALGVFAASASGRLARRRPALRRRGADPGR